MPDTSLLWILALFFFLFYIGIQFVPIANARGLGEPAQSRVDLLSTDRK